ncbi:MAG: DUF3106 domain-containing protein [Burkholderiaceae bacterium]|nr:DUF3106 domain-containing protein [Burkholderiaceae bacterium]
MRKQPWPRVAVVLAALVGATLSVAQVGKPAAVPPVAETASAAGAVTVAQAKTTPESAPKRKAAPAPSGGPLWASLGQSARDLLEPFEAQWNSWSSEEKRVWVSLAAKFPKLAPEQQAKVKSRVVEWAALTPAQRKLARANFRLARQLPSSERVSQWQRYESMTPEQRKVLRLGGRTSNTAAKHAGARTGLAKEAAKPLGEIEPVWRDGIP